MPADCSCRQIFAIWALSPHEDRRKHDPRPTQEGDFDSHSSAVCCRRRDFAASFVAVGGGCRHWNSHCLFSEDGESAACRRCRQIYPRRCAVATPPCAELPMHHQYCHAISPDYRYRRQGMLAHAYFSSSSSCSKTSAEQRHVLTGRQRPDTPWPWPGWGSVFAFSCASSYPCWLLAVYLRTHEEHEMRKGPAHHCSVLGGGLPEHVTGNRVSPSVGGRTKFWGNSKKQRRRRRWRPAGHKAGAPPPLTTRTCAHNGGKYCID